MVLKYTIRGSDDVDEGGNSSEGRLEGLNSGRTYKAQVANDIGGFGRWICGKREDLSKGNLEEKKRRCKIDDVKTGSLIVTKCKAVMCKVVD
jgi:hypothetical protein